MAYTDSQVLSATVATTAESSLGSFSIPAGRSYTITNLWTGGVGGTFRIAVDTYPSMQGKYVQNSTAPTSIEGTNKHPVNIALSGPAELTGYVTQAAATSTVCKMEIQYIDSAGATN